MLLLKGNILQKFMYGVRVGGTMRSRLQQRYYAGCDTCFPAECVDPNVMWTILQNGVRVATECVPSGIACISLFVEAGSRYETACNNGISHFIEHLAFKSCNPTSQCIFEETLRLMGAKMTAKTSREMQSFTALCPPEYAANIIASLSCIATTLATEDSVINDERYKMCLEMVDTDNDPRAITFDYLHQTAFQGTPLAHRVIGPTWNVRNFDQEYVHTFLSEHYQPYKLCFASSGPLNHFDLVRCAEINLGHLSGDACYQSIDGPYRFTGSQVIYRDDSMPFAHVAIAFEAPGYGHTDYWTLYVAACIIGEWHKSQGGKENNSSPLARAASVANLCESFESFYLAYRDVGLWGIYFVADRMKLEDMLLNIQDQWMKMCTMAQEPDIERGINLAKLKMALEVDGCVRSAHDIGKQFMYTCTRKPLAAKYDELIRVTPTVLRTVCDQVLYDRCPAVAAVGPTENLPEYNRIRAGQYWLRL